MKGDDYIKNVILKFYGVGIYNNYQAKVKIYDEYNNLIFCGYTYDGIINIKLNKYKTYNIEAYFLGETLKKTFYILNENIYDFKFNHIIYKTNNYITFQLTDYYYKNLLIKKGELLLWQK